MYVCMYVYIYIYIHSIVVEGTLRYSIQNLFKLLYDHCIR